MFSKTVNRVLSIKIKNVYRSHVVFRIIKPCNLVGGCIVWLTQNSGCHVFFKEKVQKEERNVPRCTERDMHCTYNVTSMRFRLTTVTVEE